MKIENKENKIENKIETQKAHSRAIWHLVMPCWAVLGRAGRPLWIYEHSIERKKLMCVDLQLSNLQLSNSASDAESIRIHAWSLVQFIGLVHWFSSLV